MYASRRCPWRCATAFAAPLLLLLVGCDGGLEAGDHLPVDRSWPIRGAPGFVGSGAPLRGLGGAMECYYGDPTDAAAGALPAATLEYVIETRVRDKTLHLRLTFNPSFVDNTYGANTVGWGTHPKKSRHPFSALVRSDHAGLVLTDGDARVRLMLRADYLSAAASAPSGYASAGLDGDGAMLAGTPTAVTRVSTSLDRNLNERGYASFTTDSPPTDARYTPSPVAPHWDYRVVYEAWVDVAAFGTPGFGAAHLLSIHASPAKRGDDTLSVRRGPCPADWGRAPEAGPKPVPDPAPGPAPPTPPPVDFPL